MCDITAKLVSTTLFVQGFHCMCPNNLHTCIRLVGLSCCAQHIPDQACSCSYSLPRYNSALAVSARVATSLAELMYGEYGDDMEDYWRGAWEAASGLPAAPAAMGTLREVSPSTSTASY